MGIDLELYSTSSPGTTLATRSAAVADAWELEAERSSAIAAFDPFLAVHGARLRVRMVLDGSDPSVVTYARIREPLDA